MGIFSIHEYSDTKPLSGMLTPCRIQVVLATILWLGACGAQSAGRTDTPLPPVSGTADTGTGTAAGTVTGNTAPGPISTQPVAATITCNKQRAFTVGNTAVWQLPGRNAFFFKAGLAIDADGAPDAYHPDNIGKDALGNAGRPGNWWALVTDNSRPDGKPLIQKTGDPNPGYYISTTALEDLTKAVSDPRRYVDSNRMPYFVLPSNKRGGAKLGDFAVVVNRANGKSSYAIFADIGPRNKIGEGSIALAEALGINSNPRRGGTAKDVIYLIFPNSGNGKPRSSAEIEAEGARLFQNWGGRQQLDACFP